MTTEPFIPYRERPALDKGAVITWRELESGMLFRPLAGEPSLRRVRGTPSEVPNNRSYIIGSEDEVDGRPCGGIEGTDQDAYRREFLPDGRAVYRLDCSLIADDVHPRSEAAT